MAATSDSTSFTSLLLTARRSSEGFPLNAESPFIFSIIHFSTAFCVHSSKGLLNCWKGPDADGLTIFTDADTSPTTLAVVLACLSWSHVSKVESSIMNGLFTGTKVEFVAGTTGRGGAKLPWTMGDSSTSILMDGTSVSPAIGVSSIFKYVDGKWLVNKLAGAMDWVGRVARARS